MTARELDAAGITDPALRADYRYCRALNARHGRTYFLATRLLPVARRPAVHALYGFARWADDIVDSLDPGFTASERVAALSALHARLERGLRGEGPTAPGREGHGENPVAREPRAGREEGRTAREPRAGHREGPAPHGPRAGHGEGPVVRALSDTARRYGIEHAHFADFMASMRADLVVTDYPSYEDLRGYVHGSAAVIGLQMLPVLGTVVPREEAAPHAAALGVAFQLSNFLRDVGEDLDRGRVYLPGDLLAAHGVDRPLLRWSRDTGRADARITAALREFEALTRRVYREAAPGLAMLDPVARPCIRAAYVLYGGILDAVASAGYPVLHRRVVVARRRRAVVAADGAVRVAAERLRARRRPAPAPPEAPLPQCHEEVA